MQDKGAHCASPVLTRQALVGQGEADGRRSQADRQVSVLTTGAARENGRRAVASEDHNAPIDCREMDFAASQQVAIDCVKTLWPGYYVVHRRTQIH